MAIDLKKLLPRILKIDFWDDFMDAVSTELTNVKDEIAKKEILFDIDEQTDTDQLIEIAKMFGYTPDLSLDDSLLHTRREVESIPYRIKKKTTYDSYEHVFKGIEFLGEVFLSYWNDFKLVRAREDWITAVDAHDWSTPYLFTSERDFNQFIFDLKYLDAPNLDLDEGTTWYLDQGESRLTTKHLFIEYAITQLVEDDDEVDFAMLFKYLQYLENSAHYTRKVTEVPHVGCQLSSFTDESGLMDTGLHNAFFQGITHTIYQTAALETAAWLSNDTTIEATDDYIETPVGRTVWRWYKLTIDSLTFPYHGTAGNWTGPSQLQAYEGLLKRGTASKSYVSATDYGFGVKGTIEVDWDTDTVSAKTGTLVGYDWLDADTVHVRGRTAIAHTGGHYIAYEHITYGGVSVGEYYYVSGVQANDDSIEYPTPMFDWPFGGDKTREDYTPEIDYTIPNEFHIRMNVRPWFLFDDAGEKVFYSHYIDATHYLDIFYDPSDQKIKVRWRDGGTDALMISSRTFTQADWLSDSLLIDVSLDLSSAVATGSTLWIDKVSEDTTWDTTIDVMSSTYNNIHMGHKNDANFADSVIDYIYFYDGVQTQTEVDDDFNLATPLFYRVFSETHLDMKTLSFSIPAIQLRSAVTANYSPAQPVSSIGSVVVGIGDPQDIPSELFDPGGAVPTALDNQVAEIELHVDEQESATGWKLIQTVFQQGAVTNELLGTGDGATTAYAGTLNVPPVIAGTLVIRYRSHPVDYQMEDDGDGNIIDITEGDLVVGTIDYTTGVYSFDTIKYIPITGEIISTIPITLFTHWTVYTPIRTSSITIYYQIGGTPYEATDDGLGSITGTGIVTGTVDYATGEINVTFSASTDAVNTTMDYQHQHETPPDVDDEILAEYETTGVSDITEAGLLDSAGDMILYQNFPPVNLHERKYHLSFQFFIKDGTFH